MKKDKIKSLSDLQKPDVNLFIASYMARTGDEPTYAEVIEYALNQLLKREEIYKELVSKMKAAFIKVHEHKLFFKQFKDAMYVDAIDKTISKALAEVEKIEKGLG